MPILFFLLISPCFLFAQKLDFNFFDSNGHTYLSKDFNSQIEKEYNFKYTMKMILVETTDFKDSLFKKQIEILNSLDAEKLKMIIVSACSKNEDKDGYHTSINTAKELMGPIPKFRIRILNKDANILKESWIVLQSETVKRILLE